MTTEHRNPPMPAQQLTARRQHLDTIRQNDACCTLHSEPTCCDPNDCGPCCPDCPTCPVIAVGSAPPRAAEVTRAS